MKARIRWTTLTTLRAANLAFLWFITLYVAFAFIPARALWFNPGPIRLLDAESGKVPSLEYTRALYRDTTMAWQTTIREAGPGADDRGSVRCAISSEPVHYPKASGPVVGKDLGWWTRHSPACVTLPDGAYWMKTCWTLTDPLGDLFPFLPRETLGIFTPKKVLCESTPVFYIGARPQDQYQRIP